MRYPHQQLGAMARRFQRLANPNNNAAVTQQQQQTLSHYDHRSNGGRRKKENHTELSDSCIADREI